MAGHTARNRRDEGDKGIKAMAIAPGCGYAPAMGWHDKFAKALLTRLALLRVFLIAVLPRGLLEELDLNGLRVDTLAFLGPELRERNTDLMAWAPFREQPSAPARADQPRRGMNILIDHKYLSDPGVFKQFMEYEALAQAKEFKETGEYLAMVNVVFHTGDDRWRVPTRLHNALGWPMPATAARHVPNPEYHLYSVREQPDDRLAASPALRSGTLLMKHVRDPKWLAAALPKLLRDIAEDAGVECMEQSLHYVCRVAGGLDRGQVLAAAEQAAPGKGATMGRTIYDELVAEGEAKGEARGIERGRAEGEAKGKAEGKAEGRIKTLLYLAEQGDVGPTQVRKAIDSFLRQGDITPAQAYDARVELDRLGLQS